MAKFVNAPSQKALNGSCLTNAYGHLRELGLVRYLVKASTPSNTRPPFGGLASGPSGLW